MSTSPTPEPTPTPQASPSQAPASPVAGAPTPGCASSQLGVRAGRTGAATSHYGVTFTFWNRSAATCTLYGYPGQQMLDAQGRPLPTSVNWGSDHIVQPQKPALVTLQPGEEASFLLGYASPDPYGLSCPSSTQLLVTPPNETRSLTIPFRLRSAGGVDAAHAQCCVVTVSAVYAGGGGSGPQPAG